MVPLNIPNYSAILDAEFTQLILDRMPCIAQHLFALEFLLITLLPRLPHCV